MTHPGILTEIKEDDMIRKALDEVLAKRSFDKVKANIEGFETPSAISKASGEGAFVPDITGIRKGRKSYFELAIKNGKIKETLNKWKVLSTLADLRNGKFYLLVPKGNYAFVNRMMNRDSLDAQIIKI
jgi:hypothetical protein